MEEFERSDLASECRIRSQEEGVRVHTADVGGCEILRVQIKTPSAAARLGKPMGRYVTLDCGRIDRLFAAERERARRAVAVEIREMAQRMCGGRIGSGFSVLVAGLGNTAITPDALGPETVRLLPVTRHLRKSDPLRFSTEGLCRVAALSPGISAQTGLETAEYLQGIARQIKPDLIVAVDALAARSPERLAATVQLSDTGIVPGSGIGRGGRELTAQTLGVPVMALGVPTVIDSCALVVDALRRAGHEELNDETRVALDRGRSFFVSPKEIDLLISHAADLLAGALEKAFTVSEEIN